MRTVLLASMRRHTRRYVAACLAVTIGVAFVIITHALSTATRNGLVAGVDAPYAGSDVVVSWIDGDQAGELVERAADEGAEASVLGWSRQPLATADGELVSDETDIGLVAETDAMRWQQLEQGRFPSGPGEAVADVNRSKGNGITLGDRLQVGSGSRAVDVEVVGIVDSPSVMVAAPVYLTWSDVAGWRSEMHVDSVAWAGTGSVAEQTTSLEGWLEESGGRVSERDVFVDERQQEISNGVDVIAILLLMFAAIALFVSVLVIANTFSILFAQRTRDFALLRCVGATRRQVLRSVRVEALVLGVVSSLIGLAVGTLGGLALVAGIRHWFPSASMGTVELSWIWYVAAFGVGLAVTVVASWLPTRAVVRVSPLAALRPDGGVDVRTVAGRIRIALGLLAVGVGVVLLGLAIGDASVELMVAGGTVSFTGVLLLGPLLVPGLIRGWGALTDRFSGPAGRLAVGNAVRNPRRTAATTASLLVGVTLTTAVLTGMATSRDAIAGDMDAQHPIDATLTATGEDLPASALDRVLAAPEVEKAVTLLGTTATIDSRHDAREEVELLAAPGASDVVRGAPELEQVAPGTVLVPSGLLGSEVSEGDIVDVRVGDRTAELSLLAGEGWGTAALVAPETLEQLAPRPGTRAVWVLAEPGADAEDLGGDLTAVANPIGAELESGLSERAWVELQLDVLTGAVVGLLGIAIVIALIGIGNTLGLSVLERGREIALLRAMGLTRRQLRTTLAGEALLLAGVATVLGTTLGVAFAWVGVEVLVSTVVEDVAMVLPWGQLALVVLVGALAGLISALLPARRAARVTPAAALALD
ncbi:ABC transporter permease [Nocardioides pacificus]